MTQTRIFLCIMASFALIGVLTYMFPWVPIALFAGALLYAIWNIAGLLAKYKC